MDEDFYIEDNYKRNVVILIIVLILFSFGLYYLYKNYYKRNYLKINDVTVELGDTLSNNIEDYIKCDNYNAYKLDLSNVVVDENGKTTMTGEYSYAVIKGENVKRGKIYVKDTKKPIVSVNDLKVGVGESYGAFDFVKSCDDLSLPCTSSFKDANDADLSSKAGSYKITIIVSDNVGNKIEKNVNLIVEEGYSYKEVKASDLNVDHLSNKNSNWNQTYTYKFDKALNEESTEFDEIIEKYSTIDIILEKNIKDKEIIIIYNKYGYAIGLSIKVTFEDDTFEFITNDKIKELLPKEEQ